MRRVTYKEEHMDKCPNEPKRKKKKNNEAGSRH